MKSLRIIVASFVLGFTAMALQAEGEKKDKEMPAKAAGCCAKAESKGDQCTHGCCVEAAKADNNCEKCKGAGKKEKKQDKDAAAKKTQS
ncbi:hypothetical protein ESB00_08850 [Oleiharenicola lentus]|jgi:hypothetical protein|uniref:Uncharacterized protein n=1 Tax=Oleiharenicola lentus TaxID=2508720 RepID=A0A4Q1CAK0_9BACT|nr:hypothetical protein [Oleiharenicola lentus]RXK55968.1 hypothetical protein ESB00_08850 [Oleiharenicola lentus]